MQNYIFLAIFVLIFSASFFIRKESRSSSLIMIVAYVIYIIFINPVSSAKFYYFLVASLDACIGFYMLLSFYKNYNYNTLYIALLSFTSVFVHIYGRIVYGYELDSIYYKVFCIMIVLAQSLLMIIRPLDNGLFGNIKLYKGFNRGTRLCLDSLIDKKFSARMQIENDGA